MIVEETSYRNKVLQFELADNGPRLKIDGKLIVIRKASATAGYSTPLLPYKNYPDLISLGKAVVRSGNWSGVDHGGAQ